MTTRLREENTREPAPVIPDRPNPVLGLGPEDLPAMGKAAEAQASGAHRRYLRLMRAQIVLPLVGVAIGGLERDDVPLLGVVAAVATACMVVLRLIQRSSEVEHSWYDARAAGEEIKSLAWRYAALGSPFVGDGHPDEADDQFVSELAKVAERWDLLAPPDASDEITDAMRALRAAAAADRRAAYLQERVVDQIEWYSASSLRDDTLARRWDLAFYVLAGLAVVAGIAIGNTRQVNVAVASTLGLAAAGAGAVIAWVGIRRYASLSHSYSSAAKQLSLSAVRAHNCDTDAEWVTLVDEIERVIARENTHWWTARR